MTRTRLVLASFLVLVLAQWTPVELTVAAQPSTTVDPSYLRLLRWRSVGPSRGGRVVAVAGDPVNKFTFYQGTTGGGVWKTDDGGLNWANVSDGFFKAGSVGAIAVAPSNPNVVYVGMGEGCIRGNASYGDGVYKSTDAGKTWTHMGLEATRQIGRLAGASDQSRHRLRGGAGRRRGARIPTAASTARATAAAPGRRCSSRAKTPAPSTWCWIRPTRTCSTPRRSNCAAIRGASAAPARARRSSSPPTAATPGRILSTKAGLPKGDKGRIGIALAPSQPNRVWAIIDAAGADQGIYRTDDGGETWTHLTDNADLTQRPWYYHHIFADPKNADVLWALNVDLWKSTDGGTNFQEVTVPHGDNHGLWIDPQDSLRMIEGNDGGATVTFNGGKSWSTILNQPTAQLYHVAADNQVPYRLYAAQQDNTTISVPSRSDDGRITIEEWETVGGGEDGYVAPHPTDPNIVYAADHHWLHRYDRRTKQVRDISPNPETHYGWGAADINFRFWWTYPVMVSPHDAEDAVRHVAGGPPDAQRGPELGSHQPRSHARRSQDAREDAVVPESVAGRILGADHARGLRPGVVRHDLRVRRVAEAGRRALGRLGRRLRAGVARQRHVVDQGHAARPARVRARQHHRPVAARRGHGLRGGHAL